MSSLPQNAPSYRIYIISSKTDINYSLHINRYGLSVFNRPRINISSQRISLSANAVAQLVEDFIKIDIQTYLHLLLRLK